MDHVDALNGRLLQSKVVIIVYLFLMALSIVLVKLTERIPKNVKEYEYGHWEANRAI